MKVLITCPCGTVKMYERGHVNRNTRRGHGLFCSRKCAGEAKRKSEEDKREARRRLQKGYRITRATEKKAYAKAYYWSHRDGQLSDAKRWYEQHKDHVRERGKLWRARRFFGPFAEAYLVWLELDREIARLLPDKYERLKARGCYARYNETKKERRRRERAYRESKA